MLLKLPNVLCLRKTGGVNDRIVMRNLFTSSLWFADKTLQAVTKVIILATRTTQYSNVAPLEFTCNVLVFSSLVRALNVLSGLEKDDYLALNETSHFGVTTFDFCCFRGVTACTGSYNSRENARFFANNTNQEVYQKLSHYRKQTYRDKSGYQ
jgi:hypothetical protein